MIKKFTNEQILFIQRGICKNRVIGGPVVDRRIQRQKSKRRFAVPEPSLVAKEIQEREKRGEIIKAGFFDDLVCGKQKLRYV